MAEEARGNGRSDMPPAMPDAAALQQLIVNAQYIKDLSFENPRAPQSLIQQSRSSMQIWRFTDFSGRPVQPRRRSPPHFPALRQTPVE